MEVRIEIVIPIIVVLCLLLFLLLFISCRYYLLPYFTKKQHYSKLQPINPSVSKYKSYPKLPEIKPVRSTIEINQKQHLSRHVPPPVSNSAKRNETFKPHEKSRNTEQSIDLFHFDESKLPVLSPKKSSSEHTTAPYDDLVLFPQAESTEIPRPGKITKWNKGMFKSEPIINMNYTENNSKSRRANLKAKGKALSVDNPADGQLEFSLFYNTNEECLDVTVSRLTDIVLRPEIFVGILEVHSEDQNQNNVCLVRNADDTLGFSKGVEMETGYFVNLSIKPKRLFSGRTGVVFAGEWGAIFDETLQIRGYTHEQLSKYYLCLHVLCKFGQDEEPLVVGEVKVPLKNLQVSKRLPFVDRLSSPEEELVLVDYLKSVTDLGFLEIYLSFNPIAQKLVVKVIQATGLPKIGMTGSPNVSVKISLYYCNVRMKKKTSTIQKRQRAPVFNETFEFELSKDRISECDVLMEIRHHGLMYRSVIGYVIVGNSAGGEGTKQWRQLLDFSNHEKVYKIMPNKPVGLHE